MPLPSTTCRASVPSSPRPPVRHVLRTALRTAMHDAWLGGVTGCALGSFVGEGTCRLALHYVDHLAPRVATGARAVGHALGRAAQTLESRARGARATASPERWADYAEATARGTAAALQAVLVGAAWVGGMAGAIAGGLCIAPALCVVGAAIGARRGAWAALESRPAMRPCRWGQPAKHPLGSPGDKRLAQRRQKMEELSWGQRWWVTCDNLVRHAPTLYSYLSLVLHPVTWNRHAGPMGATEVLAARDEIGEFEAWHVKIAMPLEQVAYGAKVSTFDIFTEDHVALDAAMVSKWPLHTARHTWVVAIGNGERWQAGALFDAVSWAHLYDVQVLLYNGRGVGFSGGLEQSTHDLVTDALAVLCYSRGFINRSIYGRSLGAASMAVAHQRLIERGEVAPTDIAYFVSDNSFWSLPRVVERQVPAMAPWIHDAFAAMRLAPLDAATVLDATPLARHTLIASVGDDDALPGDASLHFAPAAAQPHVERRREPTGGHTCFFAGLPRFDELLEASGKEQSLPLLAAQPVGGRKHVATG